MAVISASTTFRGYRRDNGRVGVRNHVIVLPVDDISNAAAEAVANNIKGTMALPHPYGRLHQAHRRCHRQDRQAGGGVFHRTAR